MTIGTALMAIGLMVVIYAFVILLSWSFFPDKGEAKPFDYQKMDDDLPKWDKLNSVGKMANRELKKMYRGKVQF